MHTKCEGRISIYVAGGRCAPPPLTPGGVRVDAHLSAAPGPPPRGRGAGFRVPHLEAYTAWYARYARRTPPRWRARAVCTVCALCSVCAACAAYAQYARYALYARPARPARYARYVRYARCAPLPPLWRARAVCTVCALCAVCAACAACAVCAV